MQVHELLERFGGLITRVADALEDEGDRVYLGSTNDADDLRELRDEWFACKMRLSIRALKTKEPTNDI